MQPIDALRAYIPIRLQSLVLTPPAPFPFPPWEESFQGAVAFVDLSGFTLLSEALTRQGPKGIERLTEILNNFYQRMVAGVELAGGYVARFSGDALTALFPEGAETPPLARALHCGLELIHTVQRQPTIQVEGQDFILRIKVGVSEGQLYTAAFGAQDEELRYMVAGQPVKEASLASTFCAPGELMVPARLEPQLPEDVTFLPAPGAYLSIMAAVLRATPITLRHLQPTATGPAELPFDQAGRLIPATITERLRLGLLSFLAEHRPVSVIFAELVGAEFEGSVDGCAWQGFFHEIFSQIKHFGGTVDKIEQADKGNILMILFGAPRALEHHEEAALTCAQALLERFRTSEGPRIRRCGLNSGAVYVGNVGAPWRHDYTVMGDVVNVAARVMGVAQDGEILVTGRIQSRVSSWRFGLPSTHQFKGKTDTIQVWPLEGRSQPGEEEEVIELPDRGELMVGREPERTRILDAIQCLDARTPCLLVIEGDEGVGKSRLASYLVEQVFAVARVLEQRYRQVVQQAFGCWQWPLLELFGGPGEDLERRVSDILLRLDPGAAPWLAVFNPLLGTRFTEPPALRAADQRARERRLLELAARVIEAAATTPLLIVLEDFQYADPSSLALLRYVGHQVKNRPLMLCVVSRPSAALPTLEGLPGRIVIPVSPFDRETLRKFIVALARSEVDLPLFELIWSRSQGNPLFAEELFLMLSQHNLLSRSDTHLGLMGESGDVPDSLRSLVQSRLDALSELDRAITKLAAVIGSRFTLPIIAALSPESSDQTELRTRLDGLIRARILQTATQRDTFEFRHILTREVIYNSMTRSQRSLLHRRIGELLERTTPPTDRAVLAHHFELGEDPSKAIQYHLEAALIADQAFANDVALRGFEKVLALAEEHWLPLPDGHSRAGVLERMADIHFRIGASSNAVGLYRKVRNMTPDWLTAVRCLRKEADARCRQDDVPNALRTAGEALLLLKGERGNTLLGVTLPVLYNLLRDSFYGPPSPASRPVPEEDRERLIELDQVYAVMGLALYYEGGRQMLEIIHRMTALTLRLREPGRIARAFSAISFIYANLRLFRISHQFARASIDWLEQEPDITRRVSTRGTIAYALSGAALRIACRWEEAENLLNRSITLNQTVGDLWEEGLSLMNLAILWRHRGHHLKAVELHQQILELGRNSDQHLYMGEALVCDGLCLAELGRFDEAQVRIDRALSLAGVNILARTRAIAYRAWSRYLMGRTQQALSDMREAIRLIDRKRLVGEHVAEILVWWTELLATSDASPVTVYTAQTRAWTRSRSFPMLSGSLQLARGIYAARRGRVSAAIRLLEKAVESCRRLGRQREAARALRWLSSLDRSRASVLLGQSRQLLLECGLPDILPGAPG